MKITKRGRALLCSGLFFCHAIVIGFMSTPVWADARQNLQTRLAKVNSFYATFSQQVTSAEGDVVQQGAGKLWIKRPNLFNWHVTSPDESVLISDGETLWFYTPLVEQATATWLKDATDNTPFILMTRNNLNDWRQYNVKQQNDDFELTPKKAKGNLEKFTISVTTSGMIKTFTLIEQSGQRSAYGLQDQKNTEVDMNKFTFTLPKEVTLDDQRQ